VTAISLEDTADPDDEEDVTTTLALSLASMIQGVGEVGC